MDELHRHRPLTDGRRATFARPDKGFRYRVERVERPPNPNAFRHAWVSPLD